LGELSADELSAGELPLYQNSIETYQFI
jgi:hypothetical protein